MQCKSIENAQWFHPFTVIQIAHYSNKTQNFSSSDIKELNFLFAHTYFFVDFSWSGLEVQAIKHSKIIKYKQTNKKVENHLSLHSLVYIRCPNLCVQSNFTYN